MSVNSHVLELRRKHETLADRVVEAQRSPAVDALELAAMKKKKLKIKEEIGRLTTA